MIVHLTVFQLIDTVVEEETNAHRLADTPSTGAWLGAEDDIWLGPDCVAWRSPERRHTGEYSCLPSVSRARSW